MRHRRASATTGTPAAGAALALALVLGGCGPAPRENLADDWPALAARAGILAPARVQTLIDDREPRAAAEGHALWVAKGAEPFVIGANPPSIDVAADTVFSALRVYLAGADLGTPAAPSAQSLEWANTAGTWRAYLARSDTGHLLYLELITAAH